MKKIKDFWQQLKVLNKVSFMPKDYKADNRIFKTAIAVIALWLLVAAWEIKDSPGYYVKCEGQEGFDGSSLGCENSFYRVNCERLVPEDARWCAEEVVPAGVSFGKEPGYFYRNAKMFALLVVLASVVLNHFLFNKEYNIKGGIDL